MISLRKKQPLLEKFSQRIQTFPLKPGDKIMAAVSGGADSVCLLHLLRQYARRNRHPLHVVHLNHGFRPEAIKEADFVKGLCEAWEIPATFSSLPVPQICKERRLSKQEGARQVRYAFFETIAEEVGARWIALGHTADDQAETFLMRLLRGAGPEGLCAIPPMRAGKIIRPLLTITRKEILDALSEADIPFMEDPSNREMIYLRNDLRHRLLPSLERYNPKIKEALVKTSQLLQDENDFLTRYMIDEIMPKLDIEMGPEIIRIDLTSLCSLHPALQRRLLRWGLGRLQQDLRGIGFEQIEQVLSKALSGAPGRRWIFPKGLQIEKGYTQLILRKTVQGQRAVGNRPPATFVPSSDPIDLSDWDLRLTLSLHPKGIVSFSPCVASFDFDRICLPLTLRGWRPGDLFIPAGMGGRHKKLQDLFVDAKIPRSERGSIPILTCSDGILWVVGLRVDDRYRATEKTKKVLTVRVQPITTDSAHDSDEPPMPFPEEQ
ncbi:MAG: tRNA lysidine(34) synthetase TilS [Nitrospirae bacterium]|nr:tRNA lysidine(34) synthetase TilS [Candidatus Manganitrophaceae bacterium]